MRKHQEYDINNIIAEMNKLYEREVIRGFINGERFDLMLGYAVTNKGAVIEDGRIRFLREDTISRKGNMVIYSDSTTDTISSIYDRRFFDKSVEPNLNWRNEVLKYISPEYKLKHRNVEEMLLKEGKIWDLIAFADHVPHVNLDKIEARLVREGSSLQLLAYAMDVPASNKDIIRKALHDICVKDKLPESRVDSETRRLHAEHYMQFKNMFGSGKKQTERE